MAAIFAEINGLDAIAYGELGCGYADLVGMTSAIASGDQQHSEDYACPDFTHITLRFL